MGNIKRESANFERGEMGPSKSVLNGQITFYLSQLTTKFILYLDCILNVSPSSIDQCFLSVCLLSILGASANNFIVQLCLKDTRLTMQVSHFGAAATVSDVCVALVWTEPLSIKMSLRQLQMQLSSHMKPCFIWLSWERYFFGCQST